MNDAGPQSDRSDIDASLEGDEEAYARLVRRHEALVAAQMWRFTRRKEVLSELMQEVFVQAYVSLKGYRGDAPFSHWLSRIATRVGYRYWKREARTRKEREASIKAMQDAEPLGKDPTPSEAAAYLHRFLEQLAPKDRVVLHLLYFEECDTMEIASRMGWSRSLVKVRAHRARKKLKVLLEEAGFGRRGYG